MSRKIRFVELLDFLLDDNKRLGPPEEKCTSDYEIGKHTVIEYKKTGVRIAGLMTVKKSSIAVAFNTTSGVPADKFSSDRHIVMNKIQLHRCGMKKEPSNAYGF